MAFTGKVIIITGASSGIGAEAARHLAKLGAKVSIVGRNQKRLNEVADQIKSAGSPEPLAIVADITVDAERIINETIKHFGKLDVLVNNAGIGLTRSIEESSLEDFDRIINTNVRAVVELTKLAVPHLEQTKGNIVNVSSIVGLVPSSWIPFYSMSKACLDHFTQLAAAEFGPKRIRVNSINPGIVETPIFEATGINEEEKQKLLQEYSKRYPVGRVGQPIDCALAIAYLASDDAAFVDGTLLKIDGGALSGRTF